jgi:hypothetical protein
MRNNDGKNQKHTINNVGKFSRMVNENILPNIKRGNANRNRMTLMIDGNRFNSDGTINEEGLCKFIKNINDKWD